MMENCICTSGSNMYCFNESGKLYTSTWITRSNGKYYADSNGVLATGWFTVNGQKYYFDTNGIMQTGWITVEEHEYYLNPSNGVLVVNAWIDDRHYVGSDGALMPEYDPENQELRWPLDSKWNYISSYFGYRESPGGIGSTNHKGIDIPATTGSPIYAAASGTITSMLLPSQSGGGGNFTTIQHANGMITEYMHQNAFASGLSVGDYVRKGQIIGYVGNTGNSTGPHLHFGVIINNVKVDPLDYVTQP